MAALCGKTGSPAPSLVLAPKSTTCCPAVRHKADYETLLQHNVELAGVIMEKTNAEIWEEVLRLIHVMKSQRSAVEKFSQAAAKVVPLEMSCLPVDFVADAEILVHLLAILEERGARPV